MDSDSEDEDDDPIMEAEDEEVDPPEEEEEEIPEDDAQPVPSPVHSEAPDSPLPQLEPDQPDQSLGFEIPLSPGSDLPSEVESEEADRGGIGRIWDRLLAHGTRLRQIADQLVGVLSDRMEEMHTDMGTVIRRTMAIRESVTDLFEQLRAAQRDILTACEADQTFWRKVTKLEDEVSALKRDKDSKSIEIAALRREYESLRDDLRSIRQERGQRL